MTDFDGAPGLVLLRGRRRLCIGRRVLLATGATVTDDAVASAGLLYHRKGSDAYAYPVYEWRP